MRLTPARAATVGLVLLSACGRDALIAPYGSAVSVAPSVLELAGDSTGLLSAEDNAGFAYFADVTVVDDASVPLERVQVEVLGPPAGIYVLPIEAVLQVDYPSAPDDFEQQRQDVCFDESGQYNPTEEWCGWYFDAEGRQFYEFADNYLDGEGEDADYAYRPNYMIGQTNGFGRMRFFLFIDALGTSDAEEEDGGGSGGASTDILVTIGADTTVLTITSGT